MADDDKFQLLLGRLRAKAAEEKSKRTGGGGGLAEAAARVKEEKKELVAKPIPETPVVEKTEEPAAAKPAAAKPDEVLVAAKEESTAPAKEKATSLERAAASLAVAAKARGAKKEEPPVAAVVAATVKESVVAPTVPTVPSFPIDPVKALIKMIEDQDRIGRSGKIRVSKIYTKSGTIRKQEEGDIEILETPEFVGPVAHVSVDVGATLNLGDYNSAKVNVFVSVPCYVAEVDDAYTFALNKAKEFLELEIKGIKSSRV